MNGNSNNSEMKPSAAMISNIHTSLFQAVYNKNYAAVQELVKNPTYNPNVQNKDGNTVFHIAIMNDDINMLSILANTDKPYDFIRKNKDGYTPLDIGIMKHYNDLVASLIQINTKESLGLPGLSLHVAAQYNNIAIMQLLIQVAPESLNMENEHKETPFLLAVRYNHMPIVQTILTIPDADVLKPNAMNYSPLEVACFRDNYEMIRILIESGRMPKKLIQQVVSYDNLVKGVEKDEEEDLVMFSNDVNDLIVSYAKQLGISAKRSPIKKRFALLRFPYTRNIEKVQGPKNYKLQLHPSCLPDSSLFSLYSRLKVPKQMAILHQESLSIVLGADKSLNIAHSPAFLERIMSPSIPFLGQLYIDFSNIGHENHVCAFLYLDKIFYIFDTAPASYLLKRAKDIFNFIYGELGFHPIHQLVDVARTLEKLNPGYTIDLQAKEGTGYCTMWAASFIEDFYAQLSTLKALSAENRFAVFKTIYDRYKLDPAYAYKYYQNLSSRQGGGRTRRKMRKQCKKSRKRC